MLYNNPLRTRRSITTDGVNACHGYNPIYKGECSEEVEYMLSGIFVKQIRSNTYCYGGRI